MFPILRYFSIVSAAALVAVAGALLLIFVGLEGREREALEVQGHAEGLRAIDTTVRYAAASLLAAFAALYGVLFLIVQRGNSVLRQQYAGLMEREASMSGQTRALEREIADRRHAEEALSRSERLATLGQLTATVSHELRNPLGAMRSSTFFLKAVLGDASHDVQQALASVDRNIARCDRIIDELLDYTRVRAIEPHATSIDTWLHETFAEQKVLQTVEAQFDYGLPGVILAIDPDRLRRAVVNVLENACQAVGDGARGELHITTRRAPSRIEIEITDTGPGIAAEVMPHIFEPMFSTRGFGVGLGLTVVKSVMEQHAGGVEVRSVPGSGTTVVLWLPLPRVPAAGAA